MLGLVCGLLRGDVLKQHHVVSCIYSAAVCGADFIAGPSWVCPPTLAPDIGPESFKIQLLSTKALCRLVGGLSGHPVPN